MKFFLVFLLVAIVLVGGFTYWPQITAALDGGSQATSNPGAEPSPVLGGAPGIITQSGSVKAPGETSAAPREPGGPTDTSPTKSAPPQDPAPGPRSAGGEEPTENSSKPASGASLPSSNKYAASFPLPKFKPLEEIVGDWKKIPPSAFPRAIVVHKDVDLVIKGGFGKSTARAGDRLYALTIADSTLTVAPQPQSNVRGNVGIDDTDFKQVLEQVYENYKKRKTRTVYASRSKARRTELAGELKKLEAENLKNSILGPKPKQQHNGHVPTMVASIEKKDVTEFNLGMIKEWGPVLYDEIDGQPYWTATVNYDAKTIFGTFDAEAMALMRRGKVTKWIYAGSHEPVP